MAKLDVTHLERMVAQGRLAEALAGYVHLLEARPADPALRARVDMLRHAVAKTPEPQDPSGVWAERPATPVAAPPPAAFDVTPQDLLDGYMAAGRLPDALSLLRLLVAEHPQDSALARQLHKLELELEHTPEEPQVPSAPPARAPPPEPPPPQKRPATPTVTLLAPRQAVIHDERTVRSPPPSDMRSAPPAEATVVAAPSSFQLALTRAGSAARDKPDPEATRVTSPLELAHSGRRAPVTHDEKTAFGPPPTAPPRKPKT